MRLRILPEMMGTGDLNALAVNVAANVIRPSRAARLSQLVLLAILAYFFALSRALGANVRFSNQRRGQVLDGHNRVAKR